MRARQGALPTLGYQTLLWLCPDSSLLNMELNICEEVNCEFQNHSNQRVHSIDHIPESECAEICNKSLKSQILGLLEYNIHQIYLFPPGLWILLYNESQNN